MFRALALIASIAAVTHGFTCMTSCRQPLWTCINKGIPGHEIEELQKCVIKDMQDGKWEDEVECKECFDEMYGKSTHFPTGTPVEFVRKFDCSSVNRKKKCEAQPDCIWTTENDNSGECMLVEESQFTPTPTKATYIDDMQPCLTYCRDQAMDCAFTHGVDTTCVPCMRECVYAVAFDRSNEELYKPECGQCIGDVFSVLGDPQFPPEGGFALFSDYQRWMKNKGVEDSCKDSGGKWKQGSEKSRCVAPKKPKQVRCKKIKDTKVCEAIGCKFNEKKGRCAGANKFKTGPKPSEGRRLAA